MKQINIFIISILLLLLVINCDMKIDFDGDEYGDTVLRGKVVDKADSTPLDSVLFTVSYSSLMSNSSNMELFPKTDSTGSFYFDIYCMENYSYSLGVKKAGYSQGLGVTYPFAVNKGCDNYFFIEMIKDTTKVK